MKPEDQPIIQGQEYQSLPETIADLDWMEMIILDFSLFNESGGKEKLASQLKYAIHNLGCFYIINFGLSQDEMNQQFSLATSIFGLPQSEKNKFIDCKSNPTLGYKPAGERTMTQGIKDAVEIYDDPKCNSFFESYLRPPPCAKQKGETGRLCKVIHEQVLHRLLVLTTIIMEIADEESLSIIHNFDAMSDSRLRYMIQHPRSEEEVNVLQQGEEGDDDIIYRHTDFGTYTLLFNQPIAALQVKSKDSTWKWVKPLPGSIIGNVGETLEFLTGGYLKAPIHRVTIPPEDQRHNLRLSVIYFTRPDDDAFLQPLNSPVITRENIKSAFAPPSYCRTVGDWSRDIPWVIGYDYK